MTLGMRIRLWAKSAPRWHVVTSVVAVCMLGAAVVVISIPNRDHVGNLSAGASNLGTGSISPGSAGVESGSGAPGAPGAAGSIGAPSAGAPSAAGPVSSGQTAPAGPGSKVTTAEQANTRANQGTATGANQASQQRTASDRGVTADSIKVGFLIAQLGGLDATGFALGMRTDQAQAIKAYVDHANAEGGVNGRKITYVTAKSNPLDAQSMRSACLTMTQDEKVFSVMDTAATIGIAHECYAENKTPHVFTSGQTVDEGLFQRDGGYNVSTGASGTRALQNWAEFALQAGEIAPGSGKLGLLDDDCTPDGDIFDKQFKPLLQSHGVPFYEARVTCDYTAAQQQIPGAVLQMRQNGVTRVFMAVIFSTAQTFIQNAQSQAWTPKYSVSDFWGLNLDFSAKNFNADAFDRTRSYTFSRSGEEAAHVPYSPAVQECSKELSDEGLPAIKGESNDDAEVLSLCGSFKLWLAVMRRAPLNPT